MLGLLDKIRRRTLKGVDFTKMPTDTYPAWPVESGLTDLIDVEGAGVICLEKRHGRELLITLGQVTVRIH